MNVRPAEKSHSPNPYWYGLFAKNRVQIGQIWPLWPNIHFTGPYRGSPPCTLSQHPNSRETGYSNVLGRSDLKITESETAGPFYVESTDFKTCAEQMQRHVLPKQGQFWMLVIAMYREKHLWQDWQIEKVLFRIQCQPIWKWTSKGCGYGPTCATLWHLSKSYQTKILYLFHSRSWIRSYVVQSEDFRLGLSFEILWELQSFRGTAVVTKWPFRCLEDKLWFV